ncbi:hypothetical protein HBNCFIEN_01121 [Legionella sp. PC997]|nr:hypothetical protein HBNCFIEN_01121 [Legionella sp. PC997]
MVHFVPFQGLLAISVAARVFFSCIIFFQLDIAIVNPRFFGYNSKYTVQISVGFYGFYPLNLSLFVAEAP